MRAPLRCCKRANEQTRHVLVRDQVRVETVLIVRASTLGVCGPGRGHCFGGPHTRGEGLADAFAGHRITRRDCVTGEEHATVGRDHVVDTRRDRPGLVGGLGLGVGTEEVTNGWSRQDVGPQVLHVTDRVGRTALDAESDVGAPVADGERPGVAR